MRGFFIFCVLSACTGKPVSASCPIELSPPKVVVKFGGSFSANCSSSSSHIEGLGWESTYGGTGLVSGVSSVSLRIDPVTSWNIEPQCYVNLIDGDQCSQFLPTTVYQMPTRMSLVALPTMEEGLLYPMQCHIENVAPAGKLTVHWGRGNKIFHHESFDEASPSPVNKTSVFNWPANRDEDGAQIWCEAQLNLGLTDKNPPTMKATSREMTVFYPPTFQKPANETLELPASRAGREITFNCTATGNPVPLYSWSFPGTTQETEESQNVHQPILTPASQLPGIYSCTAYNHYGTSTKYFTVTEAPSSRSGTTAGILMAVFFVLIFVLGWNQTTLAAILGVFVSLGVLLFIAGVVFATPNGTFSCNKGNYLRGQPTSAVV